ncbi:MAG TPA: hypothetical protein VMV58_01285 [Desulfosporosinus sp.]|nr:hypothetical protein [Desulfosporosinus sp.]
MKTDRTYEDSENTDDTGDLKDGESIRRLESLAESLLSKRQEAIEFRAASGIERRWREDEDAFDGIDDLNRAVSMMDYATKTAPVSRDTEPKRSTVVVNVVRSKTEMAEGRFCDILLPVDDRNWGLKITPNPELAIELKDDRPAGDTQGNPLINPEEPDKQQTNADVAKAKKDKAKEKMKMMEEEIDDQLTECAYNGESRKCIKDGTKLGTGIMKGPNVVNRVKKSWIPKAGENGKVVHILKMENDLKPASKRVNPWNVYPDPGCGDDPHNGSYIWERGFALPREVRSLISVDGYIKEQLIKVLKEDPKRLSVGYTQNEGLKAKFEAVEKGKAYESWEYYGDVDREDLEAAGCDCSQFPEEFNSLAGSVLFINNRPVKVMLNTLDTGDMPYDFFPWGCVNGSPWGVGIPRILIYLSRIIIAAWRAMMDNAGDSSGAQLILGKGVTPADGNWEFTAKKIWLFLEDDADVRKAFTQFQLESNQEDLEKIIRLALEFIDMETSLPMLFQGEQGETPETLGATNIMVDANNVGLRPRVKLWDDKITKPHLTRYYDWNMQYNERSEIKGDYNVDARGTSVLLAKDQQVQTLMAIMKLRDDKLLSGMTDWKKAYKMLLSSLRLDQIMKSDDDIKRWEKEQKEKPPEVDPKIQADQQVAQARMQVEKEIIDMKQKHEAQVLKFKEDSLEKDRQLDRELKQFDFQIKMMEYAEKRNIGLDKVKADLAQTAATLNLQEKLAKSDASGPQVAKPKVEPEGRAKEGKAFQD